MERSLSYQAKREVLHQKVPQYREASLSQKRTLLDAFVATTGYVRKYAMWLLNHAEEAQQTLERPRLRGMDQKSNKPYFLPGKRPIRSAPNG